MFQNKLHKLSYCRIWLIFLFPGTSFGHLRLPLICKYKTPYYFYYFSMYTRSIHESWVTVLMKHILLVLLIFYAFHWYLIPISYFTEFYICFSLYLFLICTTKTMYKNVRSWWCSPKPLNCRSSAFIRFFLHNCI